MKEHKMKVFFKKQASNILLIIVILLFLIPQTRKPLQIGLNRLFASTASEISTEKREILHDYDWELVDLEGNRKNFAHSEGKVTIINFWATWCPPCIAEMPSFQSLYDDYEGKVDFYFISSEKNEVLENFMSKKAYDFPVFQPASKIPEKLLNNSLPTTYVISKNGEIVIEKEGAADWNSEEFRNSLEGLLKEN